MKILGIVLILLGTGVCVSAVGPTVYKNVRNMIQTDEVITLNDSNSVVMDQVFEDNSVQQVMLQLQALSDKLPKEATIYLVMDTPGGSVDAGMRLISFIKGLPQKVKTITLYSASMGFITVQALDERLILQSGTLMSHPASFGVRGSTPYQVQSRLGHIMQMITDIDEMCAKRMGTSLLNYQNMVHDELWIYGSNAVIVNAADRQVLARCGTFTTATKTKTIDTIFGSFEVEVSSCPLIPGILSLKAPKTAPEDAANYVRLMFTNKSEFTNKFIITNTFKEYQK